MASSRATGRQLGAIARFFHSLESLGIGGAGYPDRRTGPRNAAYSVSASASLGRMLDSRRQRRTGARYIARFLELPSPVHRIVCSEDWSGKTAPGLQRTPSSWALPSVWLPNLP